jgi:hypothetical protein
MPRVQLNENAIRDAVLPEGKTQEILWDTKTKGLGVLVGANTRTFIYQRDLPGGKTRRVTLGRWRTITLTDARQEAARKYAEMLDGIDPAAERRRRVAEQQRKEWETYTLRQARDHHLLNMKAKNCSQRSMDDVIERTDRHLSDWLDRPLATITPAETIERHRKITANSGPYAANGAFDNFRGCYNSARRLYRELPECPSLGIVRNAQHRRREPIEDLAAWYTKVQTISNPVRRDFHLFVLLTGLRAGPKRKTSTGYASGDATTVRFSEIDWDKGTLRRPCPKGGEKRAFTVPLSAYVLAMLARRQMENQMRFGATDWVFPSLDHRGEVTHISCPKEQRYRKDEHGKVHKVGFMPSPHRSRDTFVTICETEAGVDPITTKALINHKLPSGDVTTGYVRPGLEHMRKCVEKVNAIMLAKMGVLPDVAPVAKGA